MSLALAMSAAESALDFSAAAPLVLNVEPDTVTVFGGIDGESLRAELAGVEPEPGQRLALFLPLASRRRPEDIVAQVLRHLRDTALALWPLWFTNLDLADAEGAALSALIRAAGQAMPALSYGWVEAAATLAGEGKVPAVPGLPPETELRQLCLAIHRDGLNLVVAIDAPDAHAATLVHTLEWIARAAPAGVVVLCREMPPRQAPFDRILYGAQAFAAAQPRPAPPVQRPWLAPVVERPDPFDANERRLAQALARDDELASLFVFNTFVVSLYGSRSRASLVWKTGRVIVEIDAYGEHGTPRAFRADRHQDYELMISGYAVLRLTTDEIAEDLQKAVEKIRDVAIMRRPRDWRR